MDRLINERKIYIFIPTSSKTKRRKNNGQKIIEGCCCCSLLDELYASDARKYKITGYFRNTWYFYFYPALEKL